MYEIKNDIFPKNLGPYSQGIKINNFIFTSCQLALNNKTNIVIGNIFEQTMQVLENIKNIIESGGGNINNLIKTTVFLTNINDSNNVNYIYKKFFDLYNIKIYPVRSCIEVTNLPMNAIVGIEAIAYI